MEKARYTSVYPVRYQRTSEQEHALLPALSGLWDNFLDALFPPSETERLVLSLPASEMVRRVPNREHLPSWQHAVLSYREPLTHTLINLLKYKNSQKAAWRCAELLMHELPQLLSERLPGQRYLVVPIPTSRTRFRERGYSQTERIAKALLLLQDKDGPLIYAPILLKSRETSAQTKTESRSERLQNLKGSFAVKSGSAVLNVRIILIDDVITTGSTLEEARKALESAGAAEVLALAVAH